MIGIIIGIAAVITIMSLGNGFKQTASEQFEDTGAGKDSATVNYMTSSGEGAKDNPFSQSDLDIAKQVNGVTDAKIKESDDQGYSAKMTNAQKKATLVF